MSASAQAAADLAAQMDVFLSYNSEDRLAVDHVVVALRDAGVRSWKDDRELQPGTPWLPPLQEALGRSQAIVVFIGPAGFGKWQQPEIEAALSEQVRRGCRVIPVFLPGTMNPDDVALPLFLRRNTWVIFKGGLDDQEAITRLIWGITGKNPYRVQEEPTPPTPESEGEVINYALSRLSDSLKSGPVTFFIGNSVSRGNTRLPPSGSDIARELLAELELIDRAQKSLLPPVDVAGSYYALKAGEKMLQNKIADLIAERSRFVPALHGKICELLRIQANRTPRRTRIGPKPRPLIVTTSLDLMMERALLRAGISFTRIVQDGAAPQLSINEYRNVSLLRDGYTIRLSLSESGSPTDVSANNFDQLDSMISSSLPRIIKLKQLSSERGNDEENPLFSLNLQDSPVQNSSAPILYKFRGSQDIPESCVISTDQYFTFARSIVRQNLIPDQLMQIICNTALVFLGCSFLDRDFRLGCQILLRQALETSNDRYAVRQLGKDDIDDTSSWLEKKFWTTIKLTTVKQTGIVAVEDRGEDFMDKLIEKVSKS